MKAAFTAKKSEKDLEIFNKLKESNSNKLSTVRTKSNQQREEQA